MSTPCPISKYATAKRGVKTQSEFIFNFKSWAIIVTRAEKPYSQRYDVAKGKIILKTFSDSSGYSCETCRLSRI